LESPIEMTGHPRKTGLITVLTSGRGQLLTFNIWNNFNNLIVEIVISNMISSVENLHVPAPPTFITHDTADDTGYCSGSVPLPEDRKQDLGDGSMDSSLANSKSS